MTNLLPRHGETHFANIPYGYYALLVCVAFVLNVIAARLVLADRPTSCNRWYHSVIRQWYNASPLVGLVTLFVPLMIPFVHHYSIWEHATVYLKRLGRLSYVLATLNLFLTLRPNLLLPRYVYLELVPLHKWVSRSIFFLAFLHGLGFLIWWAVTSEVSVFENAARNVWNLVGVVDLFLLTFLVLVSIKPMRRLSYRFFYLTHTVVSWAFVFLTALHARPGVFAPFTIINSGLLFLHIISKTVYARAVELNAADTEPERSSGLVRISLQRKAMPDFFPPGCHLRISPYRRFNPLYYLLPSHPYTVASLPSDNTVECIVREHVRGFKLLTGLRYTVQNHYESVPRKCLESATRIAIVCGGSGISFGLPLFQYFADSERATEIRHLQFIWLVRDKNDLSVLAGMSSLKSNDPRFHIYVTRNLPKDDTDTSASKTEIGSSGPEPRHDDLEFELDSLDNQLDQNGAFLREEGTGSKLTDAASTVHLGRKLDWAADLAQLVHEDALETTWLVACGPTGLNDAAKRYAFQNKINLASERYAL
ncbi:LADA_0H15192g1_1 [Lachancea dasiensis]|uniref:Probable metalloreductase AIM14 n=1 Tax=Lachancea dasiensis TaxID=1072105 RepID=A0A1G4K4W4_9SACH|nr:LADA_0H15192g1_1 [Lachancea dasiensis]